MPLDIPWPIPEYVGGGSLKSALWRLGSNATIFTCGTLCKVWLESLNSTTVHNHESWIQAVEKRAPGKPLLTIANHTSNIGEAMMVRGLVSCIVL